MPAITVGVLAAHDDAKHLAERLTDELPRALGERYEDVEWHVRHAEADPADPVADERDLVEATRRRALDEGWELAIGLTDLPLSVRRRPVRAHVSPQHGVGLVSVPALGAVRREERLREIVLVLIERLVCDDGRVEQISAGVDDRAVREAGTLGFTGSVLRADFRLLVGMVRANQPARAAAGMSHAVLGALGTAAFALTSQNIWSLADRMSVPRMVALLLICVTLTTVALIVAHGLWERTSDPSARERVVLFNISTAITLTLGTAALYAVLFVISLLSAAVLIPPSSFEEVVRHAVGVDDYLRLAWLVASIATVGGALGSLIDSDKAVRNAVYHPRPSHDDRRGNVG
jgi:uncharacterized membrane protein